MTDASPGLGGGRKDVTSLKAGPKGPLAKRFHDLNNTIGALGMNLEVARDPAFCKGESLEALRDASEDLARMKSQLAELRAWLESSGVR